MGSTPMPSAKVKGSDRLAWRFDILRVNSLEMETEQSLANSSEELLKSPESVSLSLPCNFCNMIFHDEGFGEGDLNYLKKAGFFGTENGKIVQLRHLPTCPAS